MLLQEDGVDAMEALTSMTDRQQQLEQFMTNSNNATANNFVAEEDYDEPEEAAIMQVCQRL
jgi:hypothetical protein